MEFSHLLLLLLLLLLLFFSTASSSQPVSPRYTNCAPTSFICGDTNFNIGYPFRVDGRHDYCGYPNFYLSCTSNDTDSLTITIGSKNFHVTSIDYDNRLLYLVDTAFASQSCPQPYVNTTVDATNLFRISDRSTNLTLFINCTASSTSIPAIYDMMCLLSVTGQHSYYRLDNGTMDDVLGRCRSTVVVPMAQDAATRMVNGDLGFGAALQQGFSVNWLPGTGWCSSCVSSGGRCGYNSSAPADHTCYCSNGTFIDSCYPPTPTIRSGIAIV